MDTAAHFAMGVWVEVVATVGVGTVGIEFTEVAGIGVVGMGCAIILTLYFLLVCTLVLLLFRHLGSWGFTGYRVVIAL